MVIPSLQRINELSKKQKEVGLSEAEKEEQTLLRKEYLRAFRGSVNDILLNSTIIDPLGDDVTPEKLKAKQNEIVKKKDE
ncbi:DUF896 domain-containing protein [Saccharibacillus sp. CPCC 101409]|uniref:DUF896 domain-containing protein n=1 Tax=Saccharibacillus sp. CPCC 101409 TaxID=3058041 RepID=UPI002672DEB1|nr:DUF896 domain-containing protein [Saccharibacillus sp. CPCC 101409]MDO3412404.1 DUF896 domain-containing protein [Saccharibacillus sp. CPCC 101409]